MEHNIQTKDIIGSLKYGGLLTRGWKGFLIFMEALGSLLIASAVLALVMGELDGGLETVEWAAGFIAVGFGLAITGTAIGITIYNRRHIAFIERCLSCKDCYRSKAAIRVLKYVEGRYGRLVRIKMAVIFKHDGKKHERKSRRSARLFAKYFKKCKKIDIVYSPAYDEVLLIKMD